MTNSLVYNLYNHKVNKQNYSKDYTIYENIDINENLPDCLKKKNIKKFTLIFKSPYISNVKNNDDVYCEIFINNNKSISSNIKLNELIANNISNTTNNNAVTTADNNTANINTHINKITGLNDIANETEAKLIENIKSKAFKKAKSLIILLHGFASKLKKLDNYYNFISKLLDNGFDCAFLNQPYHLHRTPDGENSGERLIYFGDIETLNFYHQAVVDVRKLIDITINKFNFKKIILCGFSLGSMVATIATAFDERIDKSILLLGGGNWYEIHWNSLLAYILKGNCISDGKITKEKCQEFYKNFPNFLEEFKRTDISKLNSSLSLNPDLKEKTTKMCFLCDPLAFAHKIDSKKILMINSKFDHYFPKKSTLQLWKELGKPKIYWFAKLHTSKIFLNPKVFNIILNFLKS